jgi:hypothetical protein
MAHTRLAGSTARATVGRTVVVLVQLTVVLGLTVAVSWLAFGGRAAFNGPDRVLRESWPLIYGSQAVLAAVGLYIFARHESGELGIRRLAALVLGAWLGELLALTLGGNLLANELDPDIAWFYWLMGTGGPIQPVAAFAGGLLGIRFRRSAAPVS